MPYLYLDLPEDDFEHCLLLQIFHLADQLYPSVAYQRSSEEDAPQASSFNSLLIAVAGGEQDNSYLLNPTSG